MERIGRPAKAGLVRLITCRVIDDTVDGSGREIVKPSAKDFTGGAVKQWKGHPPTTKLHSDFVSPQCLWGLLSVPKKQVILALGT